MKICLINRTTNTIRANGVPTEKGEPNHLIIQAIRSVDRQNMLFLNRTTLFRN